MKKVIAIFATFALFAIVSQNVMAQASATDNASASANIITVIELTKQTDLHFGDIVPDASNQGTVIVAATSAGARTSNNVTLLDQFTNESSASFLVEGEKDAAYAITFGSSSIQLTSGGNNMTVDSFTTNKTNDKSTLDGTTGEDTFYVGATLTVNGGQAAGLYTGSFDVTVTYE